MLNHFKQVTSSGCSEGRGGEQREPSANVHGRYVLWTRLCVWPCQLPKGSPGSDGCRRMRRGLDRTCRGHHDYRFFLLSLQPLVASHSSVSLYSFSCDSSITRPSTLYPFLSLHILLVNLSSFSFLWFFPFFLLIFLFSLPV